MPRTKEAAPATAPKAPRQQRRGHFTTIDLPDYVAPQVKNYLAGHSELGFKQMVLLGFSHLGIQVNEEDLVSIRRARGLR
jgi:hypothetical protein